MRRAVAALAALLAGCAVAPPPPGAWEFGVMGDTPYSGAQEPEFVAMIGRMDAQPLAFVIHVGDIKAGSHSPCTDELYARRKAQFDASTHPLVYTPGDNEWTDCRRATNGGYDPLERLAVLREVFFAGRRSLGRVEIDTVGQDEAAPGCTAYPENRMWSHDGVWLATINVPGPDDNEGVDAASDAEARCRDAANAAWIERAAGHVESENARALVIATQADPWVSKAPGFVALLAQVAALARRLERPVLFVHGDTHVYRHDTPFRDGAGRTVANAFRLETYGSPFVGWVRVTVDPADPRVFSVQPNLVAISP